MAVISDAFHVEQRVTEAFGIVRSKFIRAFRRIECAHLLCYGHGLDGRHGRGLDGRHLPRTRLFNFCGEGFYSGVVVFILKYFLYIKIGISANRDLILTTTGAFQFHSNYQIQ
jgi:hypothetical protein